MVKKQRSKELTAKEADAFFRAYNIHEAMRLGKAVEIDGVVLDFTSGPNALEWQAVNAVGLYGGRAQLYQPEIIFPWTPRPWREALKRDGAAILAKAGTRVELSRDFSQPVQTQFGDLDHPSNIERRMVQVRVVHANGKIDVAQRLLQYIRRDAVASLVEIADYWAAYRGMLARLEVLYNVDDIEDLVDKPIETWPRLSEGTTPSVAHALFALRARDDVDGHAMAAFGYMIGRMEAESQWLNLARLGDKNAKSTRIASAAKRALDFSKSEPVRETARAVISKNPRISLSECARLTSKEHKQNQAWIHRTIKPLFILNPDGRTFRPRRPEELIETEKGDEIGSV